VQGVVGSNPTSPTSGGLDGQFLLELVEICIKPKGFTLSMRALFLLVVTSLTLAASETPPVHSSLLKFTDEGVNRFIAQADQAARVTAPLSAEFWSWVEARPEIHLGLLFAQHPMPAGFAENLDKLRRSVKPTQADRYAHLLLGVAVASLAPLRTENETATTVFAPEVLAVATWMKASATSYLKVMEDPAVALAAAGLKPEDAKSRTFWTDVAHASGTYPQRLKASEVDHLRWLVDRLDEPAPEGAKQPWPIFPMAQAPWPLLVWFRDVPPERERDWVWERYWGRIPQQPAGIIGYGRYSWDYARNPAFKYKASAWHPNSLPRIWEDGGVCGRLSTMADVFRRTLGIPARGCGQPGHRAFVNYTWDVKKSAWGFAVGQSISGIDATRVSPGIPALTPYQDGRAVTCQALIGGINLGLERWHRARILSWYAFSLPTVAGKERLAREALALNPYEISLWKWLVDQAEDAPALARTLAAMDSSLVNPDLRLEEAEQLSASTDFATLGGGAAKASSDMGNSVAKILGDSLLKDGIERLLKAGAPRTEALATVRREIERRQALKLNHGPAITHQLLTRLTVQADGIAAGLALADADLKALETLKAKARTQALDKLTQRFAALKVSDPAPVAEWAGRLLDQMAGPARWSHDKQGAVVPERLFQELHNLHVHALGRTGPTGKARIPAATKIFERGKPPAKPSSTVSGS